MKSVQTRENARKLKLNPHQSKDVQSQSPPHKKLLKKIEMIHKEPNHKYDLSLKENLLAREPQEEVVVDFRVEIERRFNKAVANQVYKFPRHKLSEGDSANESAASSLNSSFESLKHVTIYDLSSQNNKRKAPHIKQGLRMAVTEDKQAPKSASNHGQRDMILDISTESVAWEEEERSGIPIELRIRDKTSATYRKLLNLIEQQLNPNGELHNQNNILPIQQTKKQQTNQEQPVQKILFAQQQARDNGQGEYNGIINTVEDHHDLEIRKLEPYKTKKERNVRSQGRQERAGLNLSEFQRQSKAVSNSGIHGSKKNLSQEKVASRIDTNPGLGNSTLEKTLSHLNISTTKGDKTSVDLSKMTQESFKKLYNSHIMKSITPQYTKNSKVTNLKENMYKVYAQENCQTSNSKSIMDSLYQKAKNEVLNNKLKVSTVNPPRSQTKNANSSSVTKRDETPKDVARKVNFNNFYGSPEVALEKSSKALSHTSQNMTKKESMKNFQVSSPYKKPNDAPIYASYDFTSQSKITKKPNFKLDLNKRGQAYRDALSSTRNRKKRTPDKFSDILSTESGIRNSYDMQQYSYILNSSSQKNTSKKPIGFTPSSTAKNLSFTKAFFSYK